MSKLHYFNQEKSDSTDIFLKMAIQQGYVPKTCLLSGQIVMGLVKEGRDPCEGCACDRNKCEGRMK